MRQAGFTLVEILVAMFIFVLVATIIAMGLRTVVNTQNAVKQQLLSLGQLQVALTLLERDMTQIVPRPVTDRDGQWRPALLGNDTRLTFTRGGLVNPLAQEQRSTLQRVSYRLEKGALVRTAEAALDQLSNSPQQTRVILTNVVAIKFAYLDKNNVAREFWPLVSGDQTLPRAIQVVLTLRGRGVVSRLFIVPGGVNLTR
ncbi:MAG: type II secretion system minor pseudopilin GspJ [Coxiellaceae bacterium]|nr:MAG: type II secretion system minor pseudopilin GspJ [Coxiellaceae bacterium]